MGWGNVFANITGWFTPQQRIRRLKDEFNKLEKERDDLLSTQAATKKAIRLATINDRLRYLSGLLFNSAN